MSVGLAAFTIFHVVLSFAGIGAGFVVLYGFAVGKRFEPWTKVFLATTAATTLTGFLFPVDRFLPSHAVGILCTVTLALAYFALHGRELAGIWRPTFVICAVVSQHLNVFVLVVQAFLKIPALQETAPTQSEPPFAVAQAVVLAFFVAAGFIGVKRFRAE